MSEHKLKIALVFPQGPLDRHRGDDLLARSGCPGVLIDFERLNVENLKDMNKSFNPMRGGFTKAPSDGFRRRNFYLINAMHRVDVSLRDHYPMGDESWKRQFLTAN